MLLEVKNVNFRCVIWMREIFFWLLNSCIFFLMKGELFYEKLLKRSVLKSQFQNPQNMDKKSWFFHHLRKNNFKITTEQKTRLNRFSCRLLEGIVRGTNEIRAFLEETLLSKTTQRNFYKEYYILAFTWT